MILLSKDDYQKIQRELEQLKADNQWNRNALKESEEKETKTNELVKGILST